MSKHRVTTEVLRSGQPRAYADTEHVVLVKFEHVPWDSKTSELEPDLRTDGAILREQLAGLRCGFVNRSRAEAGFLGTYLDYLRPVGPLDPEGRSHVWEFRTVSPYTD